MKTLGYSKSFLLSVLMHVVLLACLLSSFATAVKVAHSSIPKKHELLQAVVVDQKVVAAEVKRLEKIENLKENAAVKKEKALAQKLRDMEQKSAAEQQKLTKLKSDMAKIKKTEEKRLADLKSAKIAEEKALKVLQAKQQQEKNKLAAIEKEQAEKKSLEKKRQAELEAKLLKEAERIVADWKQRILSNRREAVSEMSPRLYCKVAITIMPDGSADIKILKKSDDPVYDKLSVNAIRRSEPFELPEDVAVIKKLKGLEIEFPND